MSRFFYLLAAALWLGAVGAGAQNTTFTVTVLDVNNKPFPGCVFQATALDANMDPISGLTLPQPKSWTDGQFTYTISDADIATFGVADIEFYFTSNGISNDYFFNAAPVNGASYTFNIPEFRLSYSGGFSCAYETFVYGGTEATSITPLGQNFAYYDFFNDCFWEGSALFPNPQQVVEVTLGISPNTLTFTDTFNITQTYTGVSTVVNAAIASNNVEAYIIQYEGQTATLVAIDTLDTNNPSHCMADAEPRMFKQAYLPNNPDYQTHLPTYFGNVLFWYQAAFDSLRYVHNTQLGYMLYQFEVFVNMIQGNNPGGPGFIGGSIFAGVNKTAAAAGGATVVFFNNANQDTIAYAITDGNGNFSRPNLPYGTYRVAVDYLNHSVPDQFITLSANTPSVSDVEFNMTDVTSATEAQAVRAGQLALAAWPNPTAGDVTLSVSGLAPGAPATATVRDATGRTLLTQPLGALAPNGTSCLATTGLPAGLYLVTVTSGSAATTLRLMVQ